MPGRSAFRPEPTVGHEGAQSIKADCTAPLQTGRLTRRLPADRPAAVRLLIALQPVQMGVKYIFAEQDAPPTVGSRRDAERRQPIAGIVGIEPEPGRRGKLVPDLVPGRLSPVPSSRLAPYAQNPPHPARADRDTTA